MHKTLRIYSLFKKSTKPWSLCKPKKPSLCFSVQSIHTNNRRIFSGVQPTGTLHLGNYFGAIEKWVSLQTESECIYSIVDLHSITLNHDPTTLRNATLKMTATLLACGICPEKCVLFLQSQVPEHTELCWILNCLITMARLKHQPQFKEKTAKLKDIPMGIFLYPVLQSADILAYKATHVPVGEDQIQHIQLAQHLCHAFNNKYGKIFPIPEPIIDNSAASRLKSLRNPSKKMSKSDTDPRSRIELTDSSDVIREKIKKAITDFTSEVTYDPVERPGVSNIIFIHSLVSEKSVETICDESRVLDTQQYKLVVADSVIERLKPISSGIEDLMKNPDYLTQVLKKGGDRARQISSQTLVETKTALGIL